MKFTIIKSCLARFSGIFAVGTPSNIHGAALSYRCAKFGAFVNSVTSLTLRDLTMRMITSGNSIQKVYIHGSIDRVHCIVVHSYIMNAESWFQKKLGRELNKFNRRLFFNER